MTAGLTAPSSTRPVPQARRDRRSLRPRAAPLWPLTVGCLGLVALLGLLRWAPAPVGPALTSALDLTTLPTEATRHVEQVLLLPVGALVVVVGRLVLGLRALGVLSPVLLGVALTVTGPVGGIVVAVVVLVLTTGLVRPATRTWRLPFAARVAVQLTSVSVLLVVPLVVLRRLPALHAEHLAYLPPVALALVTERLAATAQSQPRRTTLVRSAVTLGEALVIAVLGTATPLVVLLARRPELLLLQVWAVVLVATRLQLRLFEPPAPPRPARPTRSRTTSPKERPDD